MIKLYLKKYAFIFRIREIHEKFFLKNSQLYSYTVYGIQCSK